MKVREEVVVGASTVNKYFIYDGGNVVLDFVDTDGHLTGTATPVLEKRYFQGPGVDQLLAQENVTQSSSLPNRVWWVLPDHLGSTRDVVTSTGGVVAHFQFDSFGVLLDGRENVTRYQYTGREHDSNTDLNYHRARWYDPLTGKWMSEDPIGFEARGGVGRKPMGETLAIAVTNSDLPGGTFTVSDGEGFEPTVRFHIQRFSRPSP